MYVEAVKAGLLAYDQRTKLHSMWKRFQRWITKGSSSILIVRRDGTACGRGPGPRRVARTDIR